MSKDTETAGDRSQPGERLSWSLPFGRWAGVLVEDVPTDYLCWARRTLSLRTEVRELIARVLQDRYDAWRQRLADRSRARKELADRRLPKAQGQGSNDLGRQRELTAEAASPVKSDQPDTDIQRRLSAR